MDLSRIPTAELPPIPAKRYFTIGEVSELCGVKPHVLRYWEQEFTQLKPVKRRGNRRYYQHHEVLLIRRIRELLYNDGFTISGARNRLGDLQMNARDSVRTNGHLDRADGVAASSASPVALRLNRPGGRSSSIQGATVDVSALRRELEALLADISDAPSAD